MKMIKNIYSKVRNKLKNIGPLKIIWTCFRKINLGYKVYTNLVSKYGCDTHIYVEHYPGTGDVYLTCALLQKYHLEHYGDTKYILTVIGGGSVKIAKLLGIKDVVLLSQEESDAMIAYSRFIRELPNFKILHYSPIELHTRILDNMASYKDLDFMTMYLSVVFDNMKWDNSVSFPEFNNDDIIDEYFDENGLKKGKTVILFPNANTIEDLPWQCWEHFARRLREVGFTVCTNVEPGGFVIPGTCDVFVPYAHLKSFVEKAGYIVSLRSGVCDIIADSECYKFVLYPTPNIYKFGIGTIYDYFSLIKMGIAKKTYEYEFERVYVNEAFETIFNDLCVCSDIEEEIYKSDKRQFRNKIYQFGNNNIVLKDGI